MNLSIKQKEVIKLLRHGWELYVTIYSPRLSGGYSSTRYYLSKSKEEDIKLHHQTFQSLRRLKLINSKPYNLTALGKTIDL